MTKELKFPLSKCQVLFRKAWANPGGRYTDIWMRYPDVGGKDMLHPYRLNYGIDLEGEMYLDDIRINKEVRDTLAVLLKEYNND